MATWQKCYSSGLIAEYGIKKGTGYIKGGTSSSKQEKCSLCNRVITNQKGVGCQQCRK